MNIFDTMKRHWFRAVHYLFGRELYVVKTGKGLYVAVSQIGDTDCIGISFTPFIDNAWQFSYAPSALHVANGYEGSEVLQWCGDQWERITIDDT